MNSKIKGFIFSLALITASQSTFATVTFANDSADKLQLPASFHSVIERIKETNPELIAQIGGFFSSYGQPQLLEIQNSNGNFYTQNGGVQGNVVPGAGIYFDVGTLDHYQVKLGLDWLFLPGTPVSGYIQQEQTFTNLSYKYKVQNSPLFVASKIKFHDSNDNRYSWLFDLGIGPNFMRTSHYSESPLTAYTVPDNAAFSTRNQVTFATMLGLGVRFNQLFQNVPIECGYRFLYLGSGSLNVANNSSTNTLSTGQNYAHAILCGVVFQKIG